MRTQQEIVDRINARKDNDPFGFEWQEYLPYLDFEHAREYLNEDVTEADWTNYPNDQSKIRGAMIDYMDFAWEKANGCRGISAGRSIAHYVAWLWLEGSAEAEQMADEIEHKYEFYGKPQLRRICRFLDLDPDKWDDGLRVNDEYELASASPLPVGARD